MILRSWTWGWAQRFPWCWTWRLSWSTERRPWRCDRLQRLQPWCSPGGLRWRLRTGPWWTPWSGRQWPRRWWPWKRSGRRWPPWWPWKWLWRRWCSWIRPCKGFGRRSRRCWRFSWYRGSGGCCQPWRPGYHRWRVWSLTCAPPPFTDNITGTTTPTHMFIFSNRHIYYNI